MPEFAATVIVQLTDDLANRVPYQDDVVSAFPEDARVLWTGTLPNLNLDRTLPTVDAGAVANKLNQNELDNGTPSHNLLGYYRLAVPAGVDGEALAAAARSLPFVEHAYVEQEFKLAGVDFTNDPLAVAQGYLGPAPVGVNALHAWTKDGGDGTGVKFVDVENGFLLNHEDLVASNGAIRIPLLPIATPSAVPQELEHSTNVLGVVMAADNEKGVIGISPSVQGFAAPVTQPSRPETLDDALIRIWLNPRFGTGTILLIEHQAAANMPVETDLFVRHTIAELTRSGFAVIEPAGNGGHDLDTFTDAAFGQIFDRNVFDSGAIFVGAAASGLHERMAFSCHGQRIDCFAWGENIVTTSTITIPPGGLNGYTNGITVPLFGGTSGAAAIIAGTAIALQGMQVKRQGAFLEPSVLRELLSDIDFNTGPAVVDIGRIGVMPDLQRLALEIGVA